MLTHYVVVHKAQTDRELYVVCFSSVHTWGRRDFWVMKYADGGLKKVDIPWEVQWRTVRVVCRAHGWWSCHNKYVNNLWNGGLGVTETRRYSNCWNNGNMAVVWTKIVVYFVSPAKIMRESRWAWTVLVAHAVISIISVLPQLSQFEKLF